MPNKEPPPDFSGVVPEFVLRAGTELVRVHQTRFAADSWNHTRASSPYRGGRFDATSEDPFGYLYAGSDEHCAVSEALLRDVASDGAGALFLLQKDLKDRSISWLKTLVDLRLVALTNGRELRAVVQDSWLTKCEARDYASTRHWGRQIRAWAPWAQGFVWRSRLEEANLAYIFFADRCPPAVMEEVHKPGLEPPDGNRLDSGMGKLYVERILEEYGVAVPR